MTPQYQFNLGQGDPLLTSRVTSPEQFYDNISQEIERLNALKQQFTQQPIKPQPQVDVWSEIDEVLGGVEIGNGKVRMNIPVINKVIEFDTDDVKTLKETLISK